MKNIKKRITNPITVIAIFATLSETSAAITLPFLDNKEREVYVWFLISFPFYLLLLFFATLNFNYRSLYAPSDYEKSEHFIDVLDDMEHRTNSACAASIEKAEQRASPLHTAHPPPDEAGSLRDSPGEKSMQLPGAAKSLHIIDAREIREKIELGTLFQKIQKPQEKLARVILLLTDSESEKALTEYAIKIAKQTRKHRGVTFFVVYNLSSQGATAIK